MSKDVWELIIQNSSLTEGDAWEHLNNQKETETIFVKELDSTVTLAASLIGDIISSLELDSAVEQELAVVGEFLTPTQIEGVLVYGLDVDGEIQQLSIDGDIYIDQTDASYIFIPDVEGKNCVN